MTKTIGELLREKLDNTPINICSEFRHPSINFEEPKRKQIKVEIKGRSEMYSTTKVLISLGGRDNLVLDVDSQLLNMLSNARIAKIDREWDGGIKTVQYLKDKPTISIVSSENILPVKSDPSEKLQALEKMQESLKNEQDSIAKQISALNND